LFQLIKRLKVDMEVVETKIHGVNPLLPIWQNLKNKLWVMVNQWKKVLDKNNLKAKDHQVNNSKKLKKPKNLVKKLKNKPKNKNNNKKRKRKIETLGKMKMAKLSFQKWVKLKKKLMMLKTVHLGQHADLMISNDWKTNYTYSI